MDVLDALDKEEIVGTTDRKERPVPLTVNVNAAAIILGVGRSHIYNLIKKGELPAIALGSRRVIPLAVITRLIDSAERTNSTKGGES